MSEEEKKSENKFALELNKKMLNYNSCNTNGQFFFWVLNGYWICDLQRECLTPGKAVNIPFTTKYSLLKVSEN